ncbi:CBS domain-containing protein [Oceanicoccus sp. KOV_DT_Chl]|uniref:CBS domain-containing protein n=1 Tax=Oceanicoccus sp. KOV_DT_Chl TaxID=1904639 RepID=UPI000C7978BA|nr:CBS domain-containing protein [Oceanicoccus sp. KOV_DT_Chl]
MKTSIEIKDHMLTNPVSISAHAPLAEAVQLILRHKISGLCVVDADKKLLGVLSELDCLKGFMTATYNSSSVGPVSDYMTRDVDVVHASDNMINVANDMLAKGQRRRPVVENGRLVGQITCRQMLSVVEEFSRSATYA